MAQIKAFRGMRFSWHEAAQKGIGSLCCPPYDIISDAQREQYLTQNPHNIIRLELPRGEMPYHTAGQMLSQWLQQGVLEQDCDEGIYIYEEEFHTGGPGAADTPVKKVNGIVCRVKIEDFKNGVVLPHEETLSKAKQDRFNLMRATGCNFSQIYSLYLDPAHTTQQRIDGLMQSTQPRYEFDDGDVIHRLWVVNDPVAIAAFCEDFAPRKLYIADGHHRYETAINFRNDCEQRGLACEDSQYVMMMLVDMEHEGLVVFPTHRLVRGLAGFDPAAMLQACARYFDVEPLADLQQMDGVLAQKYAAGQKAYGFICRENAPVVLTLKDIAVMNEVLPEKSDASRGLDVSVLHSLVLERILGIDAENMAKQINLTYTRSFDEAVQSVQDGDSQCAFILNPTRVAEIAAVATNGEKMPQKSTYFYPKLITGAVMNRMEGYTPVEDKI